MKTILIADDHADIRRLVAMTLEFEGFTLLQARNGTEALALAQRHRPDLVLLDVLMPGKLNGLEVCHLIKTNDALAHTRVLLLSACGQPRDQAAGREAGADDFIVKPFSPLHLIQCVNQLLRPHGAANAW